MKRWFILLLFVAAALMTIQLSAHKTPWLMADETMYARGAWSLLHKGFIFPQVPGAMNYPPLYPLLLSPASIIGDLRMAHAAYQGINLLLFLAGATLVFYAVRQSRRKDAALPIAALYLACPSITAYVPLVMSENLMTLLMLCVAVSLHRWGRTGSGHWLIAGWAAALLAPFCRGTGIVVPVAFLFSIGGLNHTNRHTAIWIRRAALGIGLLAMILLLVLPTSILRLYHPLHTAAVVFRSLLSPDGWVILARNMLTESLLLLAGSAGLILLLFSPGLEDEQPVRRYLVILLVGLLAVTVGYMQYGSQGPHSEFYQAIQRYLDPGIGAVLPWVFILHHRPRRRISVILTIAAGIVALLLWPHAGFKPGQTLASASVGLATVPFPSLLSGIPPKMLAAFLVIVPGLVSLFFVSRRPGLVALYCILIFLPLTHGSLMHSRAMSAARERAEPALWELSTQVPPNAEIVLQERDLNDESLGALYSGIFWLPANRVRVLENVPVQTIQGDPVIQLTKRWLPEELVHAGCHKWYMRGRSRMPVEASRLFYDFGWGDNDILFSAPPADFGDARWSGESPLIELHLAPRDYVLHVGNSSLQGYGYCQVTTSVNDHRIGSHTTADTTATMILPKAFLRSDGRQLLSFRVSPRGPQRDTGPWALGFRLDWIYCEPANL